MCDAPRARRFDRLDGKPQSAGFFLEALHFGIGFQGLRSHVQSGGGPIQGILQSHDEGAICPEPPGL
jgi:hypothetical protein